MNNLLILIPQLLLESSRNKDVQDLKHYDFSINIDTWVHHRNVVYQKGEDLILLKSDVMPKPIWINQKDLRDLMKGKTPMDAYLKLTEKSNPELVLVIKELEDVGIHIKESFSGVRNEHLANDKEYQTSFGEMKSHYQIRDGVLFLHRTVYDTKKKLKTALLLAYMERNALPFDDLTETLADAYLQLLEERRSVAVAS